MKKTTQMMKKTVCTMLIAFIVLSLGSPVMAMHDNNNETTSSPMYVENDEMSVGNDEIFSPYMLEESDEISVLDANAPGYDFALPGGAMNVTMLDSYATPAVEFVGWYGEISTAIASDVNTLGYDFALPGGAMNVTMLDSYATPAVEFVG